MSILSNVAIRGRWTMGSAAGIDYIDRLRVGTGTPGNADLTTGLLCGVLEVDNQLYHDGALTQYAQAHNSLVQSGTATAHTWGINASKPYFRINTLSAQVEVWKRLEVHHSGGAYNAPAAAVAVTPTRQIDSFRYRLGQNSGVGGMLNVSSPYSGRKCVIMDAFVERENNTSGCSHISIGVTSGASTVGNVMAALPITATGTAVRNYTAPFGGSGVSGGAVPWAGTNKLVVTASAGAAGGASNFSGALMVLCKLVD